MLSEILVVIRLDITDIWGFFSAKSLYLACPIEGKFLALTSCTKIIILRCHKSLMTEEYTFFTRMFVQDIQVKKLHSEVLRRLCLPFVITVSILN